MHAALKRISWLRIHKKIRLVVCGAYYNKAVLILFKGFKTALNFFKSPCLAAWAFEKVDLIYEVRMESYDLLNSKRLLRIQQIADRNSKFADSMGF